MLWQGFSQKKGLEAIYAARLFVRISWILTRASTKLAHKGGSRIDKIQLSLEHDSIHQITVLETIQLKQRKETGSKPDKSSLVREAINLLAEKYS